MKITVYGAGAIGCYLGGLLIRGGLNVTLYGREHNFTDIHARHSFLVSDYQGHQYLIQNPTLTADPKDLIDSDVIILTVKCGAVKHAVEELLTYCKKTITILALQNGMGSETPIQAAAYEKGWTLVRGLVGFNVAKLDGRTFHQGTEGNIHYDRKVVQALGYKDPIPTLVRNFAKGHVELLGDDYYDALVWAKLQLNLNNAINALADLPLKTELEQRPYRLILAAAMQELIDVCKHQQRKLPKLTKLPAEWLPKLLPVPNLLFKRLANSMLNIDPHARSSMWDDIKVGRKTEVDFINGAVVNAAQTLHLTAPVNEVLQIWIHEKEDGLHHNGIDHALFWEAVRAKKSAN